LGALLSTNVVGIAVTGLAVADPILMVNNTLLLPFNGMDVGCDNGSRVSPSYVSPFRFTGQIRFIDVELLSTKPGPDAKVHHDSEMGKQ
jgi:hypothetical protein